MTDGPIPIKLKDKFLNPFCKTQKSTSGRTGNKGRHKLNAQQKAKLPPQPKMVMHIVNGRARMERVG
jgi:hypothetical protein